MDPKKLDAARIAQREYMRKWRADHPEAVKAAQVRYWSKKGAEMRAAATGTEEKDMEEE